MRVSVGGVYILRNGDVVDIKHSERAMQDIVVFLDGNYNGCFFRNTFFEDGRNVWNRKFDIIAEQPALL